jgi:hypothetical protein
MKYGHLISDRHVDTDNLKNIGHNDSNINCKRSKLINIHFTKKI